MRLKDKVAIITGAANGMGEADARLFVREGASVVLTDLDEVRGRKVAEDIGRDGGVAAFLRCNAASKDDWQALLDHTCATFGRIDIVVNNAGISASAVKPSDLDAWDYILDVNAKSCYLGTQMAGDLMKKAGRGAIVNMSSIYGLVGGPTGHPGYHASKAAIGNMTKAMAARLAPYGVRVNSVHPGFMTVMTSATPEYGTKNRGAYSAMGRIGQPIEAAHAVCFLASDEASYITGAELVVDGGALCYRGASPTAV